MQAFYGGQKNPWYDYTNLIVIIGITWDI